MSEKDTISLHLVREALLQSCPDSADVLHAAGINPQNPDPRVPASAYARLWREIARRTGDEFFCMDPRGLPGGSLAFICRSSMARPTLGEALQNMLAFLCLMLDCLHPRLHRQSGLAEIVIDETGHEPRRPFTYFTFWMIVHGVACWLAGRRLPILAIELRCAEPDYCDDYRVMFSENLQFQRPQSRMILAGQWLDLPVRRTPEELQRFLDEAPGNILVKYRDPDSLARRLRRDLQRLPAQDWPEADELARQLCLSASTFRRRLADEGHTWQGLKDSVRKELAVSWLAEPSLSLAQIAERLGFADSSSFYKAFRKWYGCNPGEYRGLMLDNRPGQG